MFSVRYVLPNGENSVLKLESENTLEHDVRPLVEQKLGHPFFSFLLTSTMPPTSIQDETRTLQELGITGGSSLRIALTALKDIKKPEKKEEEKETAQKQPPPKPLPVKCRPNIPVKQYVEVMDIPYYEDMPACNKRKLRYEVQTGMTLEYIWTHIANLTKRVVKASQDRLCELRGHGRSATPEFSALMRRVTGTTFQLCVEGAHPDEEGHLYVHSSEEAKRYLLHDFPPNSIIRVIYSVDGEDEEGEVVEDNVPIKNTLTIRCVSPSGESITLEEVPRDQTIITHVRPRVEEKLGYTNFVLLGPGIPPQVLNEGSTMDSLNFNGNVVLKIKNTPMLRAY